MIQFKVIRWKNFLSTGNAFTEVALDDSKASLIVGENGAGKSTILDALTFSLFGKSFRKINKPNLVNSINAKDCVVEIEFDIMKKSFKIVRGIKPNIFEIYCNGKLFNQDSSIKDYQDFLEKNILKMNYKSFTQIVILGSASFTPFMQLTPADRRAVIEDLLDIQVFSVMNFIVKQKLIANKEELSSNKILLTSEREKLAIIDNVLKSLEKDDKEKKNTLKKHIEDAKEKLAEYDSNILEMETLSEHLMKKLPSLEEYKTKEKELKEMFTKISYKNKTKQKELEFYSKNSDCPTCKQPIESHVKDKFICEATTSITQFEEGIEKINKQIDIVTAKINKAAEIQDELAKVNMGLYQLKHDRNLQEKSCIALEAEYNKDVDNSKLFIENRANKQIVENQIETLTKKIEEILDEREYLETAITLLKDGGIKTKIIRQYLPIINKLINKYLSHMGFVVDFNINENFEETIKSRFRDEFTYQNFSEGEKTRIDLALLFTWRAIARMRNSVNTNLLLLDEILDGSLDSNGIDEFLKIIMSLTDNTSTFIISHKSDQISDKFEKVYRFSKVRNYSVLTTN